MRAKKIFESEGAVFNLRLVPEHMTQLICDAVPEIEFSEDRPNFDYIYRREDLVELRGKKYHAKKNYINSFKKNYEYEYEPINSGMADELMEFIEFFNSRKEIPEHEMELLKNEEAAMRDVFEAVGMCEKNKYDIIIMDIMMPHMDGLTACRKIKTFDEDVPFIFLSARTEEYDKLKAFDLGIDDYITKPFSPRELVARVKAVLKRIDKSKDKYVFGGLVMDVLAHEVYID